MLDDFLDGDVVEVVVVEGGVELVVVVGQTKSFFTVAVAAEALRVVTPGGLDFPFGTIVNVVKGGGVGVDLND